MIYNVESRHFHQALYIETNVAKNNGNLENVFKKGGKKELWERLWAKIVLNTKEKISWCI